MRPKTPNILSFLLLLLEMVFRRKKGDNPLVYNLNLRTKKEKKQSSFTNPDLWARTVGSRNTAYKW